MNKPTARVKILCLYAHEDLEIIRKLETHLTTANQNIDFSGLSDKDINSEQSKNRVNEEIKLYDIFILSISDDFIASEINTGTEMQKIMHQHEEQKSVVIPMIISPCNWFNFSYARLQSLMFDKPINDSGWNSVDEALQKAVKGIEQVILYINRR